MKTLLALTALSFVLASSAINAEVSGKSVYAPKGTYRPANPPSTIGTPKVNQNLRDSGRKDLYLQPPGQFATTPRDQYRWKPSTPSDHYWLENRDSKRRTGCCPEKSRERKVVK